MAAIYCATQKYTVNSGLGIYDLTGYNPQQFLPVTMTLAFEEV
jgi:hypothetical protein